jgi:hypothetical protein
VPLLPLVHVEVPDDGVLPMEMVVEDPLDPFGGQGVAAALGVDDVLPLLPLVHVEVPVDEVLPEVLVPPYEIDVPVDEVLPELPPMEIEVEDPPELLGGQGVAAEFGVDEVLP